MKFLRQHSDSIFLSLMIAVIVIGAGMLLSEWQMIRQVWRTNFEEFSISPDDVVAGSIGRDGAIVPIDEPVFVNVTNASTRFEPYTPVIVVDEAAIVRAYPLTILAVHEIVNDVINEVPVAVTFCPMCNSAVVYRREVDGHILRMGVSGNFYGNNFLMYDDMTESWWFQFTGEAVVGDMTGTVLEMMPSQVVGFQSFAEHYPNGEVLVGDARHPDKNYDMTPYAAYQRSNSPILTNGEYDTRLSAMARVLSTTVDDTPIAYPFTILQDVGVVNDVVNGEPVVAFWQPYATGALRDQDADLELVGQASLFGRELDGMLLSFRYDNGRIFDNETNSEWNIFGEAIAGELAGKTLYDYQCYTHFWFAWSSAYPGTLVYER